MIEQEEPYEGRLSRTVLWERRGEIPLRDPTRQHLKKSHIHYNTQIMKNTLLFILIFNLSILTIYSQDRQIREKAVIGNTILGQLNSAKGWMLCPQDDWIFLDNTIPQQLSLESRSLLKHEKTGLGLDNFLYFQIREIKFQDTAYYILIKKFRDGAYRYPDLEKEWMPYTSYYAYVFDKVEFDNKVKEIKTNQINKVELRVMSKTFASWKSDNNILKYLIDDIDLREKNPTFICTENCHMRLILHIAPFKEKNIVQFQIYSICGNEYPTFDGLASESFSYYKNYFKYNSDELFKNCYYETSYSNFDNFIKLK
ncbi:MAG: hypothetical protein NT175_13125 [Bacteroidetes bacterium]|nr:hypothetical protein [Bacteroidota bacterium]